MKKLVAILIVLAIAATPAVATDSGPFYSWPMLYGWWQVGYPTASGATFEDGDFDADGDVDGVDFGIWQANYWKTYPTPLTTDSLTAAQDVDPWPGDGVSWGTLFGWWQAGYPTTSGATFEDGDWDGDGDVDGVDFGIWQANYPISVGGSAMAITPEPATLGLFLMGSLAILSRRLVRCSPKGEDTSR